MLFWTPFQNKEIDKIADMLTSKLVVISEKYFISDLPKYPAIEPISGRKIIAYLSG